ncbi:hypothetical protein AA313_de0206355 [Arthrobotrys entomopaga]|nr:hypothetical protein AA313_de0206355 [Arthrobotrys entomopaga]
MHGGSSYTVGNTPARKQAMHIYEKMIHLPDHITSMTVYTTGLPVSLSAKTREKVTPLAEENEKSPIVDFGSIPTWTEWEEDDEFDNGNWDRDDIEAELDNMDLTDDGGVCKFVCGIVVQPGDIKLGYVPSEPTSNDGTGDDESETFTFKQGERLTGFTVSATHRGIRNIQVLTDRRRSGKMGETLAIYSARGWISDIAWRIVRRYKIDLGEMGGLERLKGLHANFDTYRMVSLGMFGAPKE